MPRRVRQTFAAGPASNCRSRDAVTFSDQTTHMSISPASNLLLPYYGPPAGNNPPTARSPVSAGKAADTTPKDVVTRATAPGPAIPSRDVPATASSGDESEHVESALATALRRSRTVTASSTAGSSSSANGRYAAEIGLYQRISHYSENGPPVSGLMKSWKDIVSQTQFEDAAVAGHVKAVAQNATLGLQSGILDLNV